MKIGEQIRQWLMAHEYSLDFRDPSYIKRTIKATKEEWDEFFRLLEPNHKEV